MNPNRNGEHGMSIRILYFAATRDLVGKPEEELVLPVETTTLRALLELLTRRHPALDGRLGQVRVARNESFVDLDDSVVNGDVVALIPPVAGG